MKKLLPITAILAATIFAGCSQKDADVVETNSNATVIPTLEVKELTNSDMKSVYFDFDQYDLDEEARIVVSNNTKSIKDLKGTAVKLSGNTDEWGTDEYNYALGLKRAEVAKAELIANGSTVNITTISLGESTPVCTEKTKDCWAKNRRTDFLAK